MALFSRKSHRSFLAAPVQLSLVFAASLATAQETLPPIQFNATYRCADGTTYVIERCVPARKGEVCYFRIETAGQLPTEAYNIRSQLTGILNTCPAQASPQAAQSGKPGAAPGQPPPLQLTRSHRGQRSYRSNRPWLTFAVVGRVVRLRHGKGSAQFT